jgi:hypothetical protein
MSTTMSVKRRASVLLSASALTATALIASAGSAGAVITAGPNDATTNLPTFYRDADGVAVGLCLDEARCAEPPVAGDPVEPTFPEPGSEAMYFSAEATAGQFLAIYAIEAIVDEAGVQSVVNVARFRARGMQPGAAYRVRGPWGTETVFANADGRVEGLFETDVPSGHVKNMLRRTNAPAGFLGEIAVPGTVTGSPTGFNRVVVRGPAGNIVGQTKQFTVTGQLLANTAMSQVSTDSLTMGNVKKTTPTVRNIRVSSFGTAPLTATVRKSGANPGAFAVVNNCASAAPGTACNIQVTYNPRANRTNKAVLTIDDNGLAAPRRVALTGTGQDTARARVASSSPRRGQRVGVNKNVSARFNEAVRGVKKSTFTLTNQSNGNKVRGSVSRVGQTNRYVLNPRRSLDRGTTYRVRLIGGKAKIRDLAGNPLRTKTWKFRTR